MKKYLATVLALCMIYSLLPLYAAGEEMPDLAELEEAFEEDLVLEGAEEELLTEFSEPEEEVTDEEVPELPEEFDFENLEEVLPEELEEVAALEAGDFPVDATTFPDDVLRALILANYDTTHDNVLKGDEWESIVSFEIPKV